MRLDHRIHQLQERQPANYIPSCDNIGVRVQTFFREEGSIAGPGHGVLEQMMKDHSVLTQLDLLAIHKSQVPNCMGSRGSIFMLAEEASLELGPPKYHPLKLRISTRVTW